MKRDQIVALTGLILKFVTLSTIFSIFTSFSFPFIALSSLLAASVWNNNSFTFIKPQILLGFCQSVRYHALMIIFDPYKKANIFLLAISTALTSIHHLICGRLFNENKNNYTKLERLRLSSSISFFSMYIDVMTESISDDIFGHNRSLKATFILSGGFASIFHFMGIILNSIAIAFTANAFIPTAISGRGFLMLMAIPGTYAVEYIANNFVNKMCNNEFSYTRILSNNITDNKQHFADASSETIATKFCEYLVNGQHKKSSDYSFTFRNVIDTLNPASALISHT